MPCVHAWGACGTVCRRRGFVFERTRRDGGDGCVGDGGPFGKRPPTADWTQLRWRPSSFQKPYGITLNGNTIYFTVALTEVLKF